MGGHLVHLCLQQVLPQGFCGFGGGIYYVPVLTAFEYPMHIAIGTSSLAMIPTAGVGAINLALHGYTNLLYIAGIGLVTLVFTWIGAKATKSVKALDTTSSIWRAHKCNRHRSCRWFNMKKFYYHIIFL